MCAGVGNEGLPNTPHLEGTATVLHGGDVGLHRAETTHVSDTVDNAVRRCLPVQRRPGGEYTCPVHCLAQNPADQTEVRLLGAAFFDEAGHRLCGPENEPGSGDSRAPVEKMLAKRTTHW